MSDFSPEEVRVLKALASGILSGMGGRAQPSGGAASGGGAVAPDSDLDSQWGDPAIRFDSKKWAGESMVGRKFSETTAEYLDILADTKEWQANNPKPGKERFADYDRRDAARARGWAARLRRGFVSSRVSQIDAPAAPRVDPGEATYVAPFDDADVPF